MGDDDLDLLHVSRHRGMTIDVTGPITCEFVQPGLTQWPRAGDLVPDLVADVPRAHGPYRALADAGRTHGAASATNAIGPVTTVTVAAGPTLLTALSNQCGRMPHSRPQQLPHPCGFAGEVVARSGTLVAARDASAYSSAACVRSPARSCRYAITAA